jgi:hypothetical protein
VWWNGDLRFHKVWNTCRAGPMIVLKMEKHIEIEVEGMYYSKS